MTLKPDSEKRLILSYFNRFFALVHLNRPVIYEFHYDAENRRTRFNERTIKATSDLMLDCKTQYKVWQEDAEKSRYQAVIYNPDESKVKSWELNTFIDIRVELEHSIAHLQRDSDIIQPILWHIEHILCNGNLDFFQYLLKWMALPLQQRGAKTEVLVCITGDQGTGKGLIFDHLLGQGIYGNTNYVHVEDADKLLGRFNSLTARKLFVYLDEVKSYGNTFKEADKLKALITETTTTLEVKGLDACTISNYTNYIMATNHDVPLRIESSDRRYAVVRASSAKCGDFKYFAHLADLCHSPAVACQFYKYLTDIDITEWTARMTDEKRDMMGVVVEPEWRFLQQIVESGLLDRADDRVIATEDLFKHFMQFCQSANIPQVGKTKENLTKVWRRHLAFESKQIKRKRCACLPCPEEIAQAMKRKNKWLE